MTEIFGIPIQALLGQLMLGLVNGSFYAMLSLGLAVIFGLLGVVNFAHGALYMIGAYVAWFAIDRFGINYWLALLLGAAGGGRARRRCIERTLLKRLYKLDPLYGLLLTFGLALIVQGVFQQYYGVVGPVVLRRPKRCRARPTSASWCCRTTAASWSSSRRWWCASAPGS